jgi:hypothetical protein
MTDIIIPTTLGIIKATTLGNFIFQLAQWGLMSQKDNVKNPATFDYLSLTIDSEVEYQNYPIANGGAASIDFNFPCKWLAVPIVTDKSIIIPDYLTTSGYSAGSGGTPTFSSNSWCQSLAEAVTIMHLLQNNAAKNPYNLKPVSSWSIENQNDTSVTLNGLFKAAIELPLIQSFDDATGNLILSGASPMGTLV